MKLVRHFIENDLVLIKLTCTKLGIAALRYHCARNDEGFIVTSPEA